MRRSIIGAGLFVLLAGASATAHAGLTPRQVEQYWSNSDNSGGCYGNLYAWWLAPNSTDYVEFLYEAGNGWTFLEFDAETNGVGYYCDVPTSNTTAVTMWPTAITFGAEAQYFVIDWDANHNCTALELANSTWYEQP